MSPKPSARRPARRVLRWASTAVFALACCAVLGIVVVLFVLPRATGGSALTVLTGSMSPDIPVGSVVLLRPVDPQTLEVGDVATYQVSPESRALVTHRVVGIEGSGEDLRYVFKGDANRGADTSPVPPQAVRGEVWFHVPYLGSLRDALQGRAGVSLLAVVLLLGYAVLQLTGGLRDRRRKAGAGRTKSVTLARPALLAEVRRPKDESPADLARRWGGLLLAEDDDTVTLLVLPPVDGMGAALELLDLHDAVRVEVLDADATLTGVARPAPEHRTSDETEADRVS